MPRVREGEGACRERWEGEAVVVAFLRKWQPGMAVEVMEVLQEGMGRVVRR